MGDLIGILIPMLLGGADLKDIIRALSGADYGSSNDGLKSMVSANIQNAILRNPLRVSQETINKGASGALDAMGINPMTGFGQGLSGLLGAMYHFAPDTIGSLIGVPDPGQFYRQIANGAAGISVASGNGMPSVFNPYSVMASHANAMRMAKGIYGLAARLDEGGNLAGYNTEFTHGLNMSEVGIVAQRLLSSDLAYKNYGYNRGRDGRISNVDLSRGGVENLDLSVDEEGNYINPEDAEKFSSNLKKLGGKFNEAASMLAKITGSVEDAMDIMDRLAGGNALGGTAQQASNVANKAMKMAASIRVASAMAGVSPQEAYARMDSLQNGIASKFGLDSALAQVSGLSDMVMDPAYRATIAYSMWEANNPNATQRQKQMVMAGTMTRATSYADSSGEHLAAIISANKDLFTEDQLKQVEVAYRMGRPNDVRQMVSDVIGPAVYDMMSDPSKVMAARLTGDKDTQERFWKAAMEGNLREAEVAGARTLYNYSMDRVDENLYNATGDNTYRAEERRNAATEELRRIAVENGLTEEGAAKLDAHQLRSYLSDNGVDARVVERREKIAEINREREMVEAATMSDEEESAARDRLIKAISESDMLTDTKKAELVDSLNNGADVGTVFGKVFSRNMGLKSEEIANAREDIMGNKMSSGQAAQALKDIDSQARTWAIASTPEEVLNAAKSMIGSKSVANMTAIPGIFNREDFKNAATDKEKLAIFAGEIKTLSDSGLLSTGGDDENLTGSYSEGIRSLVGKALGSRIGNIREMGEDGQRNKEYDALVSRISKSMLKSINDGKTVGEAYALALEEIQGDREVIEKIGGTDTEGGKAEIAKQIKDARDSGSSLVKTTMSADQLVSAAGSRINRESSNMRNNAADKILGLFKDEGVSDSDSMKLLMEQGKVLSSAGVIANIDENAIDKGLKGVLSDIGLDKVKGLDVAEMAKSVRADFSNAGEKGDWKSSIERSIDSAVKNGTITKEQAEAYKKKLSENGSVGDRVVASVLDAVKPDAAFSQRLNGGAEFGAGDVSQVAQNRTASQAVKEGMDINAADMVPDNATSAVSELDAAAAERSQNRIINFIQAGNGSIAKAEIEKTRTIMSKLGEKLGSVKIGGKQITSEQIAKGLEGGDTEEAKAIESVIADSELSQLSGGTDFNRGLIKSLVSERVHVGENEVGGIDMVMSGKSGDISDANVANVTKGAYREGSISNDILGAISKIVQFTADLHEKPIPVLMRVADGYSVPVSVEAISAKETVNVDAGIDGQ